MSIRKTLAAIMATALTAFAGTSVLAQAPAAAAAPPPAAAHVAPPAADPSDTTDLAAVNAFIKKKCGELAVASDAKEKAEIRKELGTFVSHCAQMGGGHTAARSAPAKADPNAAVLAQLRADLVAAKAEAEKAKALPLANGDKVGECDTKSRYVFIGNDGKMTATCKGAADEMVRPAPPAPIVVQPAIVHYGVLSPVAQAPTAPQALVPAPAAAPTSSVSGAWGWTNPKATASSPMKCYHSTGVYTVKPPVCSEIVFVAPFAGESERAWSDRVGRQEGYSSSKPF